MMIRNTLPLLVTLLLHGMATGQSAPAQNDLSVLTGWMTGSFSSREQSENDTNYFDIRLHMTRVWQDRTDGYWLYVEQATAERQDKPYRQRVYRVTAGNGGMESAVFLLPDPLRFVGAWRNPRPLAGLAPDSLIARGGCSIFLKRTGAGVFSGSTVGHECPSDLRGATYATSEVSITDSMMVSWDRGFDRKDKQVWGATGGGYVFKKIRPSGDPP